jgi:hypothetical protein
MLISKVSTHTIVFINEASRSRVKKKTPSFVFAYYKITFSFIEGVLSAFETLRKDIVIFDVCVVMEQLRSHRTDFYEILYLCSFRKSVGNFQVSLKPEKNKGYFIGIPI